VKCFTKRASVESTTVFSGTVIGLKKANTALALATFDVQTYWNGDAGRSITVVVDVQTPDVFALSVGQRYLIFGHRPRASRVERHGLPLPEHWINPCASMPLEEATKNGSLRELGRGRVPR
jgi:hypothetical protein